MRVAGFGEAGQARLATSTVLIVGCGALGTHTAETLARAGVGHLHLVDRDIVEWSNLQRQVLFTEAHAAAGLPKAVAAAEALEAINRDVRVTAHVADCTADFLRHLPRPVDLVLDGTDNFPTRYLLNDWCGAEAVPWIYAGAVGTEAAAMVVLPGGPCLRCLWPDPPQGSDVGNCETAGILAPAIAAVTAFQAAQALRILVGATPTRGVFTCDVWRSHYLVQPVGAAAAAECPVCSRRDYPALRQLPTASVALCGRDAVQVDAGLLANVDLDRLAARLSGVADAVQRTPHWLGFDADGCRFKVFPDGRTLVFGCSDPLRAKALYDRWIGWSAQP